ALVFTRCLDSGEFATGEHVALVDPDLDANDPVGGVCFRGAIVDIGTQRVKRHTAFTVPLGTRDLDAVQTARAHDLDALGAQTHGVRHGALHGTAEHDALFELLGDGIGDQLSIDFRLADFFDVHVNRHAHQTLQVGLENLDVLALLADHDTRTSRVDGDACILGRTLDDHAANRSVLQLLLQVLAYLGILNQHACVRLVVGIPTRRPVAANSKPEPGRMYFLSH